MKIAMLGPSDMIHLRRLVLGLSQVGHEIHVISQGSARVPGATFERFAIPRPGWRYPYRWRRRWEKSIVDVFKRFDVVCVHFLAEWGITDEAVACGRLIVSPYGSDIVAPPETPLPDPGVIAQRRTLLQQAHQVTSPSDAFADRVAVCGGIDRSAVRTIAFGVDLEVFHPSRRRGDGQGCTVGFYKGFQPVYDPRNMVRAFAIVAKERSDVRFEVVGEGPLREECHALALTLGMGERIRWFGRLTPADLVSRISCWDVVAVSSVYESLCVAALEASAMGIPVAATAVGGLVEAVRDGETGLLVAPGDSEALASAIVTLLDDPELRRRMGEAGRRRVASRFDWRDTVSAWDTLLKSVADGSKGARRGEALKQSTASGLAEVTSIWSSD